MVAQPPRPPEPGRGTDSSATSARFGLPSRSPDGDWLDEREGLDERPARLKTCVTVERPRTILSRNTSPDIGFDRAINPYRGCEHGCVYCYARPTHAFHDLSPGLDFESRLFAKPNAALLLRRELARPGYDPQPIALGSNTDCFQPIERDWRITDGVLEVLEDACHPVVITTKSDRVLDQLPRLTRMAARDQVGVSISVTALDPTIARRLEPRAATPPRRLRAIRLLAEAGVPVQVSVSPVIPFVTDHELEAVLEAASQAGARRATMIPVRLPHEVAPLFREWLARHHPDRADRVMHTIQAMRGGRDNDSRFGHRMRGDGVWADLLRRRFRLACRRFGLEGERLELDRGQFRAPTPDGQMRLL